MQINNNTVRKFSEYLYKNGILLRRSLGNNKICCVNVGDKKISIKIKAYILKNKTKILKYIKSRRIPLTSVQRRLWFLYQYDKESRVAYNIPLVFRLEGKKLDTKILEASINHIIANHEIFRTVFIEDKGQVKQLVVDVFKIKIATLTIKSKADLTEVLQREACSIFDLRRLPLIRAKVIYFQEAGQQTTSYLFLLTLHHMISDAWSLKLFLQELAKLYNDFSSNSRNDIFILPQVAESLSDGKISLSLQYQDYAFWWEQQTQSQAYQEDLKYWIKKLANCSILNLPTDFPRPLEKTFCGKRYRTAISDVLYNKLQQLAAKQEVSLFTLLLASLNLLLAYFCDQDDIVIGAPTVNRNIQTFANVQGLFANTIVLRNKILAYEKFSDFLTRVKAICVAGYKKQQIALEQIIAELKLERDLSSTPLFQVMLMLEDERFYTDNFGLSGFKTTKLLPQYNVAKFALTLTFIQNAAATNFCLDVEYSVDLFCEVTIVNLINRLLLLFNLIVENPERRINEFSLLSRTELIDLNNYRKNQRANSVMAKVNFCDLFMNQAKQKPQKVAAGFGNTEITYGDLAAKSALFAEYLAFKYKQLYRSNLPPGKPIILCMDRDLNLLIALLGILRSGAAYVPLDPAYPVSRLSQIIDDINAPLIITTATWLEKIQCFKQKYRRRIIVFEGYAQFDPNIANICQSFRQDQLAYIIYTSGTSGKPKGIMVTHTNLANYLLWFKDYTQLQGDEIIDSSASIAFDFAVTTTLAPLAFGLKLALCADDVKQVPEHFCQHLVCNEVNFIKLTPVYFNLLVTLNLPLHGVRKIILGGEAADYAKIKLHLERYPDVQIFNEYGPTETTVGVSVFRFGSDNIDQYNVVPIGKPARNTEIYLLNQFLQEVPPGAIGEIYVIGDSVSRGYWKRSNSNKSHFLLRTKVLRNCYAPILRRSLKGEGYRTGDLARYLPCGNLIYLGRNDTQVKIRGFRIELDEIIAALNSHPAVKDSSVIVQNRPTQPSKLVAYFVADASLSDTALRVYLQTKLPEYMLPQIFRRLAALPLTINGKIDVAKLERQVIVENELVIKVKGGTAPTFEQRLLAIWQQILQRQNIGMDDNFFMIGGDSIISIQVVAKAREQGLVFTPKQLFANPTIRGLAKIATQLQQVVSPKLNLSHKNKYNVTTHAPSSPGLTGGSKSKIKQQNTGFPVSTGNDGEQLQYNLAPAQSGLLFHGLYKKSSDQYAVQLYWDFSNLNVKAFKAAWQQLLERHSILRTRFKWHELSVPQQIVYQRVKLPWFEHDFIDCAYESPLSEFKRFLYRDRNQGFDLEVPCSMRLHLVKFPNRQYKFVWTYHHILFDGWSMAILLKELWQFYIANCKKKSLEKLPPVPYKNYVAWLAQCDKTTAKKFWREMLRDFTGPTLLRINVNKLQLHQPMVNLAECKIQFATIVLQRSKKFVKRNSITFNTLLQLAWAIVLAKYSDNDKVIFGTVISGRFPEIPRIMQMVGLCVNTVPLWMNLGGGVTVLEILKQLQSLLQDVNQYGFINIHEIKQLNKIPAAVPLFYTVVAFENYAGISNNILLKTAKFHEKTNFPLSLAILPLNVTKLICKISYDADCFTRSQIVNLLQHFYNAVKWLIANPQREVKAAVILGKDEFKQILKFSSIKPVDPVSSKTLQELFALRVAQNAEHTALLFKDKALSYRELNIQANQLAHYLQEVYRKKYSKTLLPDTVIAICLPRCIEMLIAVLAILKSGAAYLPLDPMLPKDRIKLQLDAAGCRVVLFHSVVNFSADFNTQNDLDFLGIELDDWRKFTAYSDDDPLNSAKSNNLAYVIYTSGSSGKPKGVMLEHLGAVNLALYVADRFKIKPKTRVLQFASLSFDAAVYEWTSTLLAGGELQILAADELPPHQDIMQTLAIKKINVATLPPAVLQQFVVADCSRVLPNLKVLVAAGDVCTPAIVDCFAPNRTFINAYGPTEVTVCCSMGECQSGDKITLGKAIDNTVLYVLDRNLQLQPVGVPGELYVGGVGVARGYINQPELSNKSFIKLCLPCCRGLKVYRTGDIVKWNKSGKLEFIGRVDAQVKIRGFRVELAEIEAKLIAIRYIRQVTVIIVNRNNSKCLVAVLVLNSSARKKFSETALKSFLAKKLPDYMIPQVFKIVDKLPLNCSGKIDRVGLTEVVAQELKVGRVVAFIAPRNALEQKLAVIWQEVLQKIPVSINDNFFALGGDSIISIQILSKARKAGLKITPEILFANPTIAALAKVMTDSATFDNGFKPHCQRVELIPGKVPLAPIQQWFFAEHLRNVHYFNQAYLLQLKKPFTSAVIRQAFKELIAEHASLRLRYRWIKKIGCFEQYYANDTAVWQYAFEELNFAKLSEQKQGECALLQQAAIITAKCAALQAKLNITKGPLLGVIVFRNCYDNNDRLFIVIHHLVIDGVSWRVLLEFLNTFFVTAHTSSSPGLTGGSKSKIKQQNTGFPVSTGNYGEQLPFFQNPQEDFMLRKNDLKSISYAEWLQEIIKHAASFKLQRELEYWQRVVNNGVNVASGIPVDFVRDVVPTIADLENYQIVLAEDLTQALLQQANQVYNTQIEELLLTALLVAIHQLSGKSALFFSMESHGREAITENVDLHSTIGWFTALYVVHLKLPLKQISFDDSDAAITLAIKNIKEQLRSIPHRGIGYGVLKYFGKPNVQRSLQHKTPQLIFNYLGQLDNVLNCESFSMAHESVGSFADPENSTPYLLSINSWVLQGKLQFNCSFSRKHFQKSTIVTFGQLFKQVLTKIILHCVNCGKVFCLPEDFAYVKISQSFLDKLDKDEHTITSIYPLTPLQKGMLFHAMYAADSDQYVTQLSFDFSIITEERTIDSTVEIFRKAWEILVKKHEIFRSSFHVKNLVEPVRVVHSAIIVDWHDEDIRGLGKNIQLAKIRDWLQLARKRSFTFTKPGLLRFALFRKTETEFKFVFTHHHILLDAFSLGKIIADLQSIYRQLLSGSEIQFVSEPAYKIYCEWQKTQNYVLARKFWREELMEFYAPTEFNINQQLLDIHKPIMNLGEENFSCDPEKIPMIKRFVQNNNLTLNTIVQFAFAVLLSKYSSDLDVLFGVTVSGRNADVEEVEDMVGLFINTLPLRIKLEYDAMILSQLHKLQRRMQKLNNFAYLDLNTIKEQSEMNTDLPLFYSILVFENGTLNNGKLVLQGLNIDNVSVQEKPNYPLTLIVIPSGDKLTLKALYDLEVFSQFSIQNMLCHLANSIYYLSANSKNNLSTLSILSSKEHELLAMRLNQTQSIYPKYATLCELFIRQACLTPNKTAVVSAKASLSYKELDYKSNQAAVWLREQLERLTAGTPMPLAFQSETRRKRSRAAQHTLTYVSGEASLQQSRSLKGEGYIIALCFSANVDLIIMLLGVLKAGAAYVIIDNNYPAKRITYLLQNSEAVLLVTEKGFAGKFTTFLGKANYPEILVYSAIELAMKANKCINYAGSGESLACVVYTSGSTGKPKGCLIKHKSITRLIKEQNFLTLMENDIVAQTANLAFDAALFEIWGALLNGAKLVIVPRGVVLDAGKFMCLLHQERVSVMFLVTTLFNNIVAAGKYDFSMLRALLVGGDVINPGLVKKIFKNQRDAPKNLINCYGPTESTTFATTAKIDHLDTKIAKLPIGRPISNTCCYVLDRQLKLLPVGIPGELYIGGDGLAIGYLNQDQLSKTCFVTTEFGRLYKTGDVVKWSRGNDIVNAERVQNISQYNLIFLGRRDSQIKIRGFRIEVDEIIHWLNQYSGVECSVIVPIKTAANEFLAAYLVIKHSVRIDRAELQKYLKMHLPEFMIPLAFVYLEKLPLNTNGKLAYELLPFPRTVDMVIAQQYVPPKNAIQQQLVQIWQEILNIERVGINDDFFVLGGHSLSAIRIMAEINATFKLDLGVKSIFDASTVAELAAVIVCQKDLVE